MITQFNSDETERICKRVLRDLHTGGNDTILQFTAEIVIRTRYLPGIGQVLVAVVKGNKVKLDIAVRGNHLTAMGNHMLYAITQWYLPPGGSDFPAFTPAEAGTRFSDPGGMQG